MAFQNEMEPPSHPQKPQKAEKFYIVLDFEANCSAEGVTDHEIIEFPAQIVTAAGEVVDTFRMFVKPTRNTIISPFIHKLTGIEQSSVDSAKPFTEVLQLFMTWLNSKVDPSAATFVTCGHWDLRTMMVQQCQFVNIEVPELFKRWINIKNEFAEHCYCPVKKAKGTGKDRPGSPLGMDGMLKVAGLKLEGRHHSGIDDVKNITRILQYMIKLDKFREPKVNVWSPKP